jgi:hypothetical protein
MLLGAPAWCPGLVPNAATAPATTTAEVPLCCWGSLRFGAICVNLESFGLARGWSRPDQLRDLGAGRGVSVSAKRNSKASRTGPGRKPLELHTTFLGVVWDRPVRVSTTCQDGSLNVGTNKFKSHGLGTCPEHPQRGRIGPCTYLTVHRTQLGDRILALGRIREVPGPGQGLSCGVDDWL